MSHPRFLYELSASSCTFSATSNQSFPQETLFFFGEYGIRETIWLFRMFEVKMPKKYHYQYDYEKQLDISCEFFINALY